jgi:predicted ATPase/exonuclease VII small subunit
MEDKVAAALGVSDVDRDLQRMLNEAKEPYLLVLDGAERVSVFCRELVDVITSSAGDLKFICTSQTPLLAADELLVHLLPMSLVPSEEQEGGLSEAERLFLSCASRAAPGFKTNEKNRCQVRELCVRLDGLPLALELAATRLRTLPIVELIANLEDRFSLLDQGRSNEDGQRTLRGVLDWSLGSLPELESRLFVSLGVFPASWTTAAVQGVCFEPKIPREQLIAALSVLVDRSLVTFDAGLGGGVYRMLETVRLYARSHLPADEPSTNELNLRHAKFYLEAARNASLQVEAPPEFVSDQPNYAQAIDFYLNSSKPEVRFRALFLANRLTVHLGHADALRTLIRVIESFQTELDSELAEALFRAAGAASALYRTKLSHSLFVRAEEMADSLGLFEWSTESIRGRAEIAANQGLYDQAEILLAKAQARYQETGDSKGEARCLGGLGYIKRELGLFQQSEELTETALALSTANGDDEWRLWCMGSLASTHIAANQPERAIPILQQTLAHQERVGNRPAQNWNRTSLGVAQMQIGDFEDALLNLESVVKNMEHQNEDLTQSWPLLELGELYRRMGRLSEAKATLERSLSLCRLSGSKTLEIRAVLRLGQVSVDMQDMISARAYRTTAAAALCKTNAPALVRDLVRLESMLGSRGEPTPEGLTIENSSGEPPARVAFTS